METDNLFRLRLSDELYTAIQEKAKLLNVRPQDVAEAALLAGVEHIEPNTIPAVVKREARRAELISLLRQHTLQEIAEMKGVRRTSIHEECVNLGIENPRGPGRRPKADLPLHPAQYAEQYP